MSERTEPGQAAPSRRDPRIESLLDQVQVLNDQAERLRDPRRPLLFRMFWQRKATRLLCLADDRMIEVSRLMGEPYESIKPVLLRRPKLPGHPLLWIGAQWLLCLLNAHGLVDAALREVWPLVALNLFSLMLCTTWNVPPVRLALKGKYNDE